VDFGLSRTVPAGDETYQLALTAAGKPLGTGLFMPPEQFTRASVATFASDVFGFGCVAWFVLLGVPPAYPFNIGLQDKEKDYNALHGVQTHLADRRDVLQVRPDVSAEFQDLILKCLATKRADRFPDGAALSAACDALPPGRAAPTGFTPLGRDVLRCRRQLDGLLAQLGQDAKSTDPQYVRKAVTETLDKLRGEYHRLAAMPAAQPAAHRLEQAITRMSQAVTAAQPRAAVTRDFRRAWQELLPTIHNHVLLPLLKLQFRPDA
jgi:serine/threonine protein kinase